MSKDENVIRFAVGTPERHSSQWRIWINNNGKSDIFISARRASGTAKVSLHESGDWHYAFDSNFIQSEYAQEILQGRPRAIAKWRRPSPNKDGFTEALAIAIPETSVVKVPYKMSKNEIRQLTWISAPSDEHFVQATLLLISEYHETTGQVEGR